MPASLLSLLGFIPVVDGASKAFAPVITTVSSRVMYQIDQGGSDNGRELLMGDRRLDYVMLKMRFNEDLLVSACPGGSAYGCSDGQCGCLMCPPEFQLNFKPLQGGASCSSLSPLFDPNTQTPPKPDIVVAEAACESGVMPLRAALEQWTMSFGQPFPYRMPGVHCPSYPHLEVFPIISVWDEPVYLMLKLQNNCWRQSGNSTLCQETMDQVSRMSNDRIINLAVMTRVQTTDGNGSSKVGPTLQEFIDDCEIIPNVFGAMSGDLSASFPAKDKKKVSVRPPACDKTKFDTVASLISSGIQRILEETLANKPEQDATCIDESAGFPASPNPCWSTGQPWCPEMWPGMSCREYRAVQDRRILRLLDETVLWTSLDAFSGCVSLADSLVVWNTEAEAETTTITTNRCMWQPWEKEFFQDACCNRGLSSCCRDTDREVELPKPMEVNTQRLAEVCAADDSGQALFLRKAIAAVRAYFKTADVNGDVCMRELDEMRHLNMDAIQECRSLLASDKSKSSLTAEERVAKVNVCMQDILGEEMGLQIQNAFDGALTGACEGDELWRVQYSGEVTKRSCEKPKRCNWNPFLNKTDCVESRRQVQTANPSFCLKTRKDSLGNTVNADISVESGCAVDLFVVASEAANACEMQRQQMDGLWSEKQYDFNYDWYAYQLEVTAAYTQCMTTVCTSNGGSRYFPESNSFQGRCADDTLTTQDVCEAAYDSGRRWVTGAYETREACEELVCSGDESITDASECEAQSYACDRPCRECQGFRAVCRSTSLTSEEDCNRASGRWECRYDAFTGSSDGGTCLCLVDKDESSCGAEEDSGEEYLQCAGLQEDQCWQNEWNFLLHCSMQQVKCPDQASCENLGVCSDWFVPTGGKTCVLPKAKDQYNAYGFCNGVLSDRVDDIVYDEASREYINPAEWSLRDTGTALGCAMEPAMPWDQPVYIASMPQTKDMVMNVTQSDPASFLGTVGFKLQKGSCQDCGCRDCVRGASEERVQQCIMKWMTGSISACKNDAPFCVPEHFASLGMFRPEFSSFVECSAKCSAAVAGCMIEGVDKSCQDCDADCRPSACFDSSGAVVTDDAQCKRVVDRAFLFNQDGNSTKASFCTPSEWKADCEACGGGLGCETTSAKYVEAQCLRCTAEQFMSNSTDARPNLKSAACKACVSGRNGQHAEEAVADMNKPVLGADGLINDPLIVSNLTSLTGACEEVLYFVSANCSPDPTTATVTVVGSVCNADDDESLASSINEDVKACISQAKDAGTPGIPSSSTIKTCMNPSSKKSITRQLAKTMFDRKNSTCKNYIPPPAETSGEDLSSKLVMQWINDDVLAKLNATETCKAKTKELMNGCSGATLTVGDLCKASDEKDANKKLADEATTCDVSTPCAMFLLNQLVKLFAASRLAICQEVRPDNNNWGNSTVPTTVMMGPPPRPRAPVSASLPTARMSELLPRVAGPEVDVGGALVKSTASWLGKLSAQTKVSASEARVSAGGGRALTDVISDPTSPEPALPVWGVVFSSWRFSMRLRTAMESMDATCLEQTRGFFEELPCMASTVKAVKVFPDFQCLLFEKLGRAAGVDGATEELLFASNCPEISEAVEVDEDANLDGAFGDRNQLVGSLLDLMKTELAALTETWTSAVSGSLNSCPASLDAPDSSCVEAYVERLVTVLQKTVENEVFTLADYVKWTLLGLKENFADRDTLWNSLTSSHCDSLGGSWYTKAATKAQCEGKGQACCRKKPLPGGFCPWGFYDEETEETCGTCQGATLTSTVQWLEGGTWKQMGEMVPRGKWTTRAFNPVNRWVTDAIDWNKLSQSFEDALAQKTAEAYQDYARCRLNMMTRALSEIAGYCGLGNLDFLNQNANTVKQVTKTEIAKRTVTPTIPTTVGSSDTKVSVPAGAFPSAATVEMTVTDAQEYKGQGEAIVSANARRLTATSADASCYTVATNANNYLIGQLIGSCVEIVADQPLSGTLTLCLPIDSTIPMNSDFAVVDFAKYDASSKKFTPIATTVTSSTSSQQCQEISSVGKYCPIKRIGAGWDTATLSADASCSSMDSELSEIHSIQKDLGIVTTDYVSVSEQDMDSGASFDAEVQSAREEAISANYETVNDPSDVSAGEITTTSDEDLNKQYGVTLESQVEDPVDDGDDGDGGEDNDEDESPSGVSHFSLLGSLLAISAIFLL